MSEKRVCGTCANFEEALHPSGRVNRKHYGQCFYPVEWPTVPVSYGKRWTPPERFVVWHHTDAEECHGWKSRKI